MCHIALKDQRLQVRPLGHEEPNTRKAVSRNLQGLKAPRLCYVGHCAHIMPPRCRPLRRLRRCWKKRSGAAATNITAYYPQGFGPGGQICRFKAQNANFIDCNSSAAGAERQFSPSHPRPSLPRKTPLVGKPCKVAAALWRGGCSSVGLARTLRKERRVQ